MEWSRFLNRYALRDNEPAWQCRRRRTGVGFGKDELTIDAPPQPAPSD